MNDREIRQNVIDAREAGTGSIAARLALRAAIQQWIDTPIDYLLVTCIDPDPQTLLACQRLAEA